MMKGYQKILSFLGLWSDHIKPVKYDLSPELEVFNPLRAKIGSSVRLDTLDYRDNIYTCCKIVSHKIEVNNQTFDMVDYYLECQNLRSKNDNVPFVRVSPDNIAIMLFLDDEFGYSKDFYDIVNENTPFEVKDGDEINVYYRLNEVEIPYVSQCKTFEDKNQVTMSASFTTKQNNCVFENSQINFWDFSRDLENKKEYVFVQMEEKTGWFQIFKGTEIDLGMIQVF